MPVVITAGNYVPVVTTAGNYVPVGTIRELPKKEQIMQIYSFLFGFWYRWIFVVLEFVTFM